MRKIWNLTLNEWIKISKKTSILVIAVLMVVAVTGLCAIMRATLRDNTDRPEIADEKNWAMDSMREYLGVMETRYGELEIELDGANAAEEAAIRAEMAYLADEIDMYESALAYEINLMSGSNYLSDLLRERRDRTAELTLLREIPEAMRTAEQQDRLEEIEALLPRYEPILSGHDFAAYIALLNDRIRADETLDEAERQRQIETNDMWLRLDPEGKDAEGRTYKGIRESILQVQNYRRSLVDNLDYTGYAAALPMTPERRSEVENELAVLVYKLENGMSTSRYESSPADTAISAMTGVGLFMVVLLMTILAGSSISNEISTGSIKSLIISPARRWKIYTAKLVSLLSAGLLMTLLLYGIAMLDHGIFFGFGAGQPYVYAHSGTAGEMGFHLYQFTRLWVQFLDVAVYMCLAFMLSILTRNTAVSVGLSIAVYFSSSVIRAFLTLYRGHEWVRFIPFSNMGLAARMFPYDTSQQAIGIVFGSGGVEGAPSVGFSLVYLAVLVFCMGFVGLDSFCRRDIK